MMVDLNDFPKIPKYLHDSDYYGEWDYLNWDIHGSLYTYLVSTKGYFINLSKNMHIRTNGPSVAIRVIRGIYSTPGHVQISRAQAVLRTFVGDPPGRPRVIFLDGDKHNYDVSNLRWK